MKNIIRKVCWPIKERLLSSNQKQANRNKAFPDAGQLKNALVIWSAHDKEREWLEKIKNALHLKKIDKICFTPNDYVGERIFDVVYIKNDDVDMKGKISNANVNELLEKEYDILVDLNQKGDALTDYVVRNSCARCKISFVKENNDIDLMVDGANDVNELIEKMTLVLTKFKRHS